MDMVNSSHRGCTKKLHIPPLRTRSSQRQPVMRDIKLQLAGGPGWGGAVLAGIVRNEALCAKII